MTPTASAQIHFPDLAPPLPFRVRSAVIVARRRFGVTLLAGGALLAVSAGTHSIWSPGVIMAGTWALATLVAFFTAARAGAWSSHVGPSARVSWGLFFAGLALLAPLTLHVLLQPWEWAPRVYEEIGDRTFAGWVQASMWLTGPSHLVFAALCFLRGFRGDRRPHLALIGIVTTVVTLLLDGMWWSVYGVLPAAYVALTVTPLLFGLRRLERMHD
jgi:hypothetical protein